MFKSFSFPYYSYYSCSSKISCLVVPPSPPSSCSHFSKIVSSDSFLTTKTTTSPSTSSSSCYYLLQSFRSKMTKSQAYRKSSTASPHGRSYAPHIGIKRLSAEMVNPNQMLVKQRKVIPFNPTPTKFRHFKIYPGDNTTVTKNTSIISTALGRVKYTHDITRDVLLVNVLSEKREELLKEELWRYRTEHVRSVEENRHVCMLRTKCTFAFPKELINQPTKPPPRRQRFSRFDQWENPALPNADERTQLDWK
eukprot:GHVS01056559.1.p1 GENE.GHVS01056559.1~~GHVS01056559.1.p1  ORF type:complete len:251 (-),score=37.55 GHVS01056559.1:319-1071(-)